MFRTQQGSPDTAAHPVRVLTVGNSIQQGHGRGSKDTHAGKGMGPGSSLVVAAPTPLLWGFQCPISLRPTVDKSAFVFGRAKAQVTAQSFCFIVLGGLRSVSGAQVATGPGGHGPTVGCSQRGGNTHEWSPCRSVPETDLCPPGFQPGAHSK